MQNVTTGVAMPSFIPLSTFSTRRTRIGSRSSAITDALKAASVGARLAPIKPARATGRLGNRTTASSGAGEDGQGQPDPEQAGGQAEVMARRREGTLEASANSRSPSVISARWCTVELSTSTLTIPQLEFPRRNPAARKTSGPVRLRRGQPLRQDRPAEDHERQRDQRGFVHASCSQGSVAVSTMQPPRSARRHDRVHAPGARFIPIYAMESDATKEPVGSIVDDGDGAHDWARPQTVYVPPCQPVAWRCQPMADLDVRCRSPAADTSRKERQCL